jgi:hypothetical protein
MDRRALVLAVVVVWAAGCDPRSYKTAAVSGRVTLDGKPLANATIQFYPLAGPDLTEPGPTSVGHTDESGRYTLTLSNGKSTAGAVVGKHKVIIILTPKDNPADPRPKYHVQLPARYNRNTELQRDVPAEGAEHIFDLRSKP